MSNNQVKYSTTKNWEQNRSDYKVIEVNVSNPADSLYAVVTPVKNK
ncbi:hypothetical protein GCM10008967_01710 [Bacillus carboniphilus]|uniref:Uncharacterized protein n=1 Tax=Bacillus carboniphilus TaxID=86663 RepID=A0ABN0VQN5_9BACI